MQKGILLQDLNIKSGTVNNAIITLGDIDDSGKGRKFVSKFIQPGLVKIEGHGIVLLRKETLDASLPTIVGSPVIIQHKDVTEENADELRCGVIANAYFNQPDGWYYVDGIIWDDKAQELISNGWSVSCSYDYLAFNDEGGDENNIHYDKEFTQLNFTHLAIVNNPRYERANIVFNSKDEDKGKWVTIKGNHIFIPDGKTLDEVIKEKDWGEKENKQSDTKSKYDNLAEAQREIRKQGEMKRNLSEASQQVKEAKEHNTEKLINRLNSENFGKWVHVDEPYKLSNLEEEIDTVVRRAYKNYNGNTPPIESIYSGIQNLLGKTSVFSQERNSADFKNKLKKVEDKINQVMKEAEGYNKFDNGKWIKNKTNNSKEQDMAIIEELKKLIFKVENNKENETMVENEKVDKRKLIDEVAGIMKSAGCDDEDIRTAIGKMEKIGYDDSEASADNKKVKNEVDEEDKKVDNEEDKKEEDKKVDNEDDKEKAEDLKEEEKKDVENKCKNSVENAKGEEFFDKINKIYNSAKKVEEPSVEYESKQARLEAGKEYFG